MFILKLLKSICFPFVNKPSCLTVRPCYVHWGWTFKTSVTLQGILYFE